MAQAPELFTCLNDDILLLIFEELRPRRRLRSLSSTCRWLRDKSMPVLFRVCIRHKNCNDIVTVPSTLWPYVRTLVLWCACMPYVPYEYLCKGLHGPLVCTVFTSPDFERSLRGMTRLSTVVFPGSTYLRPHGLPWTTVKTILSLPSLQTFSIDELYLCPETRDSGDWGCGSLSPLTSLCYGWPDPYCSRKHAGEEAAVENIIRTFHHSLEKLVLPTESTSPLVLSSVEWPRLRQLRLRGELWDDLSTPFISLLDCMPNLRSLVLQLRDPQPVHRRAIWPPGHRASYPWPDLELLVVSYPDPEDQVYAHLPVSLRTLALRPWPHTCMNVQNEAKEGRYDTKHYSPLYSSGSLLRVVRQCHTPNLGTLELEYRADNAEKEMLEYVVSHFRHLSSVEIHRYRADGEEEAPTAMIAQILGQLHELRVVKLHLDFPPPSVIIIPRGHFCRRPVSRPDIIDALVDDAAQAIARGLAPSVRELRMLRYTYHRELEWVTFRLVRDGCPGGTEVDVQREHSACIS